MNRCHIPTSWSFVLRDRMQAQHASRRARLSRIFPRSVRAIVMAAGITADPVATHC